MSGSAPLKRMACIACTKTKRKCNKRTPACGRCVTKSIDCCYPAPRITPPYNLVYSQDGACSIVPTSDRHGSHRSIAAPPFEAAKPPATSHRQPATSQNAADDILQNPWFLSPGSWEIDHKGVLSSQIYFSDQALTHYIDQLHMWMKQWASEGHCPFVHSSHYKLELPDDIQDAFTTLSSYLSRSPATSKMMLQIVERRASRLVHQQTSLAGDIGVIMLDTAAHLTRTQALLIYKVIGLFDGDIRARSQAENDIDTLSSWARQLWDSAGLAASDQPVSRFDPDSINTLTPQLRTNGDVASTWQAWIFSESIRRTYLTATLTVAVYQTLKQGWAPCPGGISFTPSKGLWDTSSPYIWSKGFVTSRVNRIRCIDGEHLFADANPSDVDEFTHATLIVSYGLERFKEWEDRHNLSRP